jgi:hypothetical protein
MPSELDARGHARSGLTDAQVRAQLDRILASETFARSAQLRRFLTFVVVRSLSGEGSSLKESVIAHELYGKGTDFDGGTDPVVRVDARRLRDKLREYYDNRSDPIVISLPKGSYAPVFEQTGSAASDRPAAPSSPPPRSPSSLWPSPACSRGAGAERPTRLRSSFPWCRLPVSKGRLPCRRTATSWRSRGPAMPTPVPPTST